MLIGSNYLVWKSMIRDMLVCKDLWLPVPFRDKRLDKIEVSTWEMLHLNVATYIRCFINTSLYNNFNEENKADVLWEKIITMFEKKKAVNNV